MKKYISTLLLFTLGLASHNSMAAVGFSVSLSPSTTTINHPVQVNLSALNGGSSQLTVNNVKLTVTSTSNPNPAARIPMIFSVFNPNNTAITIGAGPNISTAFNAGTAVFFSPSTGVTGSGSGTYSIGGVVTLSDGSVTSISTGAAATINPVPIPLYERL